MATAHRGPSTPRREGLTDAPRKTLVPRAARDAVRAESNHAWAQATTMAGDDRFHDARQVEVHWAAEVDRLQEVRGRAFFTHIEVSPHHATEAVV